jgi:hypothetical protein
MNHNPGNTPTVLYLPVEIKTRELDAAILTAIKSLSYGFIPIVGTRQAIHSQIMRRRDRAAILLWKSDIEPRLKRLYGQHLSHLCILDQEIGPSHADYEAITERRLNGPSSCISRWYTLGPRAQEAGLRFFGDRSRMVGWPRIDLWRRIELGLCSGPKDSPHPNPYVLLALTGDLSNTDSYEKFLSFIDAWSSDEHTPDLIVRPHPSSSTSRIECDTINLKKVHINSDVDLFHWLENATAVIHNGSTVAVTAALSGIQSYFLKDFSPSYLRNPESLILPRSISIEISTVAEFLISYEDESLFFECGKKVRELSKDLIFFPPRGSCDVMLADLASLQVSRLQVRWIYRLRRFAPIIFYRGMRRFLGGARKSILEILGQILPSAARNRSSSVITPRSKFPGGLTANDFEKFQSSFDLLDFNFRRLDVNLFEIGVKDAAL